MKRWRALLFLFACYLLIAYVLVQLHRFSAQDYRPPGTGPDVQAQLDYIGECLRYGGGEGTQLWYPEGYFFVHALYGQALVNQTLLNPDDKALRERNLHEVTWVLARLDSDAGRAPFPKQQAVDYGVFYQGWRNRLLGGLLLITPASERDRALEDQFHQQSAALARAFAASPTRHLEAYPGQSWPVDNVVALTSLRLHDALYPSDYGSAVDEWLAYTRAHLDPATGLVPHHVDAASGAILQGARGSSLVLLLSFLPELDKDFAHEQYTRYRALYSRPVLDFVLTREYPRDSDGPMDIDSGPLLFGVSPVASGVNLIPARANGDEEIFERTIQLAEIVGVPVTVAGRKRYSLGLLPVGDAFLAWGKTITPWEKAPPVPVVFEYPPLTSAWYAWTNGIAILLAVVSLIACLWQINQPKAKTEEHSKELRIWERK